MLEIVSVDTPSLGDRGYLATDGAEALVVDAQRDFDRVLAIADERAVTISHVFETHIHNDYVTGGLALARATGAAYHLNAADQVDFDRAPVTDGDVITVGSMRLRVLSTPGHTFSHLSYALEADGAVAAVFTGGSLLNGSTGRTDLLGAEYREQLARAQHGSARRLAAELPDDTRVCPTHGFGSFCSATQTSGADTTIGQEKLVNPVLTLDEASYVAELLAGLDVYPAYYAHMGPANAAGPAAADLSAPRRADPAELRRRIAAGEWVVDLRNRRAFAAGHLRGALNFELHSNLATYLGWLIPWGAELTLIGETAEDVAAAQRELCRIGIDLVAGAAIGGPEQWAGGELLASYPVAGYREAAAALGPGPDVLLDVRRATEWRSERIDGTVNVPLPELPARMGELVGGRVWVHCQSGYRAAVAASMLDAAGRPAVLVDEDFSQVGRSGLPVTAAVPAVRS